MAYDRFADARVRSQLVAGDILTLIAEVERLQGRVEELEAALEKAEARRDPPSQPRQPEREFLSTKQAAELLGLSASTLNNWRVEGGGPQYHKFGAGRGRVVYRLQDLEEWLSERRFRHTSHESTSRQERERVRPR